MESIHSWINEEEVRKLAEELTAPLEKKETFKVEPEQSDDFAIPRAENIEPKKFNSTAVVSQAIRDRKSITLAEASAMAASVGLIGKTSSKQEEPPVADAQVDSDHFLHTVPGCIDENPRIFLPMVHPEKVMGTFEEIDVQLINTLNAKGICVIDRDGDVLYSSLLNQQLIAFIVATMVDTKLMQTEFGEFGNIRVKMSASDYLEFVSVRTTRGVLIIAISMDHVLGDHNAQYVAGDVLKIADSDGTAAQ